MGFGGTIRPRRQLFEACLLLAYTGLKRFAVTRWKHCHHRWWVLDYMNQGRQQQRVGDGKAFSRVSGMAALYAPGHDYHERQVAGEAVEESFIIFDAHNEVGAWLKHLTRDGGWCYFRDSEQLLEACLQRAAKLAYERRPAFQLLAHGVLIEVVGLLVTATPVSAHLREVRGETAAARREGLLGAVEHFIRQHIDEPVRVADLARHTRMSASAFAHTYSRLADESPHHTVQRLKLQAAKHLLLMDGLSVKECSARLGFSSEFHFSRLFKRLEGLPPAQYRRALAEKVFAAPADHHSPQLEPTK